MTHRSARRRTSRLLVLATAVAALALGSGGEMAAQQRPDSGERGRSRATDVRTPQERRELERRFEQRLAEVVQRELRTTPVQAQRLAAVSRRFEQQRRPVFHREMALRRELRGQLAAPAPDDRRVEAAMRELLQLQRQRIDIIEAEQRALAEFLTPVQRARYLALQENLRHRVDQRGRAGRSRAAAGAPPPGVRR